MVSEGPLFTGYLPTATEAKEHRRYMPTGMFFSSTKEKATLPTDDVANSPKVIAT